MLQFLKQDSNFLYFLKPTSSGFQVLEINLHKFRHDFPTVVTEPFFLKHGREFKDEGCASNYLDKYLKQHTNIEKFND